MLERSSSQLPNSANCLSPGPILHFIMAAKFPSASDVQFRPRKGHDKTWSCDKHAEPISFYCKEHNIPICHRCATKDHGQKPCQLDDIEDVILEMGSKLDDKLLEVAEKTKCLETLESKIQSCSTFASKYVETMNNEVNIAYNGKINNVKDKEQADILLINKEAAEEIRIINEKKERRVKSRRAEAEKQQQNFKETKTKLLSDIKKIDSTVGKKMVDLKSKNRHNIDTFNNVELKIKRIKQDDQTLVNEAPQVIASLDETVSENVHQDVDVCLAQIQREVERVKIVEGEIGGKQYSRIDGYNGKWELVKSFPFPSTVNDPVVCGLISDDELCVSDGKNNDLYVSNISNGHTHKVIEGVRNTFITSCTSVDSNLIVCGKYREDCRGDSLDGCITLYDRQWNVVRDITIPKKSSDSDSEVHIDVDKDGMILAAEYGQSNIYVINPADGKIVHTITMQDKLLLGGIQALSTGDIVVQTDRINGFTVISRSGEEKATIHCDELRWALCGVDKLTDTLYITYMDAKRGIYQVDQVSRDGDIQARSILGNERSRYRFSCSYITGDIVTCNEDNVIVFKKTFLV